MNRVSEFLQHLALDLERVLQRRRQPLPTLRREFADLENSALALQFLVDHHRFATVLDVGSGRGAHAAAFERHGRSVTRIDYGRSIYFSDRAEDEAQDAIIADFNEHDFGRTFDCVWCSHVLEHQLNVQDFLVKAHAVLAEGGVLAVTVPPHKDEIVGGHVALWNAGLVLYRLVLAGFDCSEASVLTYDYNISVVVVKRTIAVRDRLDFDAGDIRRIRDVLPQGLAFRAAAVDDPFDGRIRRHNWPD